MSRRSFCPLAKYGIPGDLYLKKKKQIMKETNTVSCDLQYECIIINNERSIVCFEFSVILLHHVNMLATLK